MLGYNHPNRRQHIVTLGWRTLSGDTSDLGVVYSQRIVELPLSGRSTSAGARPYQNLIKYLLEGRDV
jgi:hypothetical protein